MKILDQNPPFPDAGHNHQQCVRTAVEKAQRHCRQEKLRLTELRRRVLELVWLSHKPVGAYSLLEQFRQEGRGLAPPTIYRALEFLLQHRLIHRIASLNAYVGCNHPGSDHEAQFFICSQCGEAAELEDSRVVSLLGEDARRMGFSIANQTVEITGHCAACAERVDAS